LQTAYFWQDSEYETVAGPAHLPVAYRADVRFATFSKSRLRGADGSRLRLLLRSHEVLRNDAEVPIAASIRPASLYFTESVAFVGNDCARLEPAADGSATSKFTDQ
jgi:hypothetical protein